MQTPNSFTVTVTEEHFRRALDARKNKSEWTVTLDCPVAQAVADVLGAWPRIGDWGNRYGVACGETRIAGMLYDTPEEFSKIIRNFDFNETFPGPATGTFVRREE